jgi:hypothetical protein
VKQPGYSFEKKDSDPLDEYGNPMQVKVTPAPRPKPELNWAVEILRKRRAQRRG